MAGHTVRAAYGLWAATYDGDANRTRDLDERVTREAFADLRFRRVVEPGCGTGKNTRLYAAIAVEVHALDFSEPMLERARARGLGDHVRFSLADLAAPWPEPDGTADLIAAHLVFEHLPELDFVFAEAARVLAPGGLLHVSEFHPSRQYLGKKATFEGETGAVDFPAYVHHVSDFLVAARSADVPLAGLGEHWHDEDDAGGPPRLLTLQFAKPPRGAP